MSLRQCLSKENDWVTTATVTRETGREVFGVSSGQRTDNKESWWGNEEVQERLQGKRWDSERTEEREHEYEEMQHMGKKEVAKVKQKVFDELSERMDTKEGEINLYQLARRKGGSG